MFDEQAKAVLFSSIIDGNLDSFLVIHNSYTIPKRDMPCFKTAWKKSVFGVFLVRIFPHLDWLQKNAGMQNSEYAHILMRKITIYLHEN